MLIERRGRRPRVHDSAYLAPGVVVSGDVTIGAFTSVLAGAVITAEGGPVAIGSECVLMEHAVIRGARGHPCRIGDRVLVGPHAHLSGCQVEEDAFVATGATLFNGARVGREAEVRVHAVVQVNSVVPEQGLVPIGWVAVGDPAQLFPPSEHEAIWAVQRKLGFTRTVWGAPRNVPAGEIVARYARALLRQRKDRLLGDEPG